MREFHDHFRVENHGSVIGITPLTSDARDVMDEHLETEGWQWLGETLCVGHREAEGVLYHLAEVMGYVHS